jgi:hypothetical protein
VGLSNLEFEAGSQIRVLGEYAFVNCWSLRSICVPSSVQTISQFCFMCCRDLSNLRFESGSALSSLGESAFYCCSLLESICIPSSVETISKLCFCECRSLCHLTFESDSRLATIGEVAFCGCSALHSIFLPAGLCQFTGLSLVGSGITSIAVDSRNRFVRVSDDFLVAFDRLSLVRYFAAEQVVTIGRDVETILSGCFSRCNVISSVRFRSGCQVSGLGESAFSSCSSLHSICIPASVETVSK